MPGAQAGDRRGSLEHRAAAADRQRRDRAGDVHDIAGEAAAARACGPRWRQGQAFEIAAAGGYPEGNQRGDGDRLGTSRPPSMIVCPAPAARCAARGLMRQATPALPRPRPAAIPRRPQPGGNVVPASAARSVFMAASFGLSVRTRSAPPKQALLRPWLRGEEQARSDPAWDDAGRHNSKVPAEGQSPKSVILPSRTRAASHRAAPTWSPALRASSYTRPDAPGGSLTHWLVYGIPPGVSSLAAVPVVRPKAVGPATAARARRAGPADNSSGGIGGLCRDAGWLVAGWPRGRGVHGRDGRDAGRRCCLRA
jgi:hypothetical protein